MLGVDINVALELRPVKKQRSFSLLFQYPERKDACIVEPDCFNFVDLNESLDNIYVGVFECKQSKEDTVHIVTNENLDKERHDTTNDGLVDLTLTIEIECNGMAKHVLL